ncbi:MAG TPA: transglutaminase family protein [Acidimicrobiales bacterium]|nr:transglutaminase family protein [Acidimicrobiales bacterium]
MAPAGVVVSAMNPSARPDAAARAERVWRLDIEHTTTYRYSTHVRASFNEVRAMPQSSRRQTALETSVTTIPPAPLFRYRDYWGTQVLAFDIAGPHDLLQVRSGALVETRAPADPPRTGWREVDSARGWLPELCAPSLYTAWDDGLGAQARRLRRDDPLASVEAVASWVHDTMTYAPGTTGVGTTALEAWRAGRGVCQDYAHLTLAMVRALGIPARYVSGYLHPHEDARVGDAAAGESHAWVEAWTGDWWGIDPTNAVPAGLRHVVVAQGRDYADVPPVKGIYAGTAEDDLRVDVRITRVA